MKKDAIDSSPEYYLTYIDLVDDDDINILLDGGGIDFFLEHFDLLNKIGDRVYAEGKWTIKQLVQHLIDCERIFQYRILRFLRNDETDLPGFDEDHYANNATAANRSLEGLIEEFQIVRLSSQALFGNLSKEDLLKTGSANGVKISVLAMGFILVGHPLHHANVIKERYFPIIDES